MKVHEIFITVKIFHLRPNTCISNVLLKVHEISITVKKFLHLSKCTILLKKERKENNFEFAYPLASKYCKKLFSGYMFLHRKKELLNKTEKFVIIALFIFNLKAQFGHVMNLFICILRPNMRHDK